MPTPASARAATADAQPRLRSLHARSTIAWRSPGRFTKNPDLVRLPTGRLLFVYSDNDQHWSQETQILTIIASDDHGTSWHKLSEVARADLRQGDERMVTPRLSLLSDGRLAVLIDHDDFGHFHEDQPFGMWLFWSHDGGKTWSKPEVPAIPGFEPDRIIELPDGRLAVGSQVLRRESMEFAEIFVTSSDGGRTWQETATIAHDGVHRHCEGGIALIDRADGRGQELACVMRENHCSGVPSFVTFSQDLGRSWSAPQMLPFAIHRPYVKQLPDGRALVTGRHVNGMVGCVAWAGKLRAEAGHYQIGGPRCPELARLTPEGLVLTNGDDKQRLARYSLLPAESSRSEVRFEARVRIERGEPGKPVAMMTLCRLLTLRGQPVVLYLGEDFLCLGTPSADTRRAVDLRRMRTVTLHHRAGLLTVAVDGQELLRDCIVHEELPIGDFIGDDPLRRTVFGTSWDQGVSVWESVRYEVKNPTLPHHVWAWSVTDGVHPDDYQRRRLVKLHGHPDGQDGGIDCGYSSWLVLPEGEVLLVDYSSQGEAPGKSHIVSVRFRPDEIP